MLPAKTTWRFHGWRGNVLYGVSQNTTIFTNILHSEPRYSAISPICRYRFWRSITITKDKDFPDFGLLPFAIVALESDLWFRVSYSWRRSFELTESGHVKVWACEVVNQRSEWFLGFSYALIYVDEGIAILVSSASSFSAKPLTSLSKRLAILAHRFNPFRYEQVKNVLHRYFLDKGNRLLLKNVGSLANSFLLFSFQGQEVYRPRRAWASAESSGSFEPNSCLIFLTLALSSLGTKAEPSSLIHLCNAFGFGKRFKDFSNASG